MVHICTVSLNLPAPWNRLGALLVMLVMLGAAGAAGADAATAAEISRARAWDHGSHTRFVLESSQALQAETFLLSTPNRLVVDFPALDFKLPPHFADGKTIGPIAGYRFGQFKPGISRLVLDLAAPATIQSVFSLPPNANSRHRLVIDLVPADQAAFDQAARAPETETAAVSEPALGDLSYDAEGRYTIVIDPGHGGVDPGAIGRSGIYEKDIALAAARELAAILEKRPRYRVILTRDDDVFLKLRDRVALGRREGAHMFVSIHADSIGRSGLRGAHVYSLSENASDKEAAALAAKENKADIIAGVDLARFAPAVGNILLDLAQRETNNVSAEIAELVVKALRNRSVKVLGKKPHRQAGFAVLKAPDVPSLLIELGYLSNKTDEKLLRTKAGRAPILEAVADAIDKHFDIRMARQF